MYCRCVETVVKFHNQFLHNDKLFSCIYFCSYFWIRSSLTQLTLFIFVERAYSIHSGRTCNQVIHIKTYCGTNIGIVLIRFWTWEINKWTLWITPKHISNVVSAYFDDGYAHIVDIDMLDAGLKMWLPCVMILYLCLNIPLAI